ncbi:MAG: c-type cytochrome domain-containing protein [Cyclobacteriaceae bacterium]
MERLKKIVADTVLVVQILIAFILVFESYIQVPLILQAFGRLHPLLLHLPIGLLLITTVLIFAHRYFKGHSMDDLISFMLHLTAFTASFTTLMGLLLSLEGSFGTEQLFLHKWLGVALSFLCWMLLAVKTNAKVLRPLSIVGVVLLVFTGHFGANLTHGEDFVLGPLQKIEPRVRIITDSTALFTAAIEPILESKCYSCHNSSKAKGNLILTSLDDILEGGKNGALWKTKDAAHSLMMERLSLPLEDKEHMPPKDKAQLTEDEIQFISLWIDEGTDTNKKLNELTEDDTLKQLASAIISRYETDEKNKQLYAFKFPSKETVTKLNTPHRTVFQIAGNEPAVKADFYLRQSYQKKYLEELGEVKEQLIFLNLSNMPVEDSDLKTITQFKNLEVLNLNNTQITGKGFQQLASLSKLRSLSLSGTKVSREVLLDLKDCKNLKEVFLWNTGISEEALNDLSKELGYIYWDFGYIPDSEEVLKLNVPLLKNRTSVLNPDEKVLLKHNLPGTTMRYTLDGTDPDSIESPVFKEPFVIGNYALIKTKAFKDGWLTSDVVEFIFFRKGFRPDTTVLLSVADERFEGEGAITLVDENKGLPDFYRHPAWIAFRENDLVATFAFERKPTIRNVTLSYARNPSQICLPPAEMQVWGGNDPERLQLIAKVNTPHGNGPGTARIEGVSMDIPPSNFGYYKLVAKPVRKIPGGNPKKRGIWLMVDEVFFN